MRHDIITAAQEVLFDLHDLLNDNDDHPIEGFSEFETLHDYLGDQIEKMSKITAFLMVQGGEQ